MEVITPEQKKAFVESFPEDLQAFVNEGFKLLYVENGVLSFTPPTDKEFMTANKEYFLMKSSLLPKFKASIGVENAVVVKDPQAEFLAKAIELMQAKKVEIVLKRGE